MLELFAAEACKESCEALACEDFPEYDDEIGTKHALPWLGKPYGTSCVLLGLHQSNSDTNEVRKNCKDACITDRRMIWSTDLDETLELENLIDQAALESYSAEARKEPREAHAHEDFPEQDDENWTKPALSWLDKPFGEVAEVALKFCADFCCTL